MQSRPTFARPARRTVIVAAATAVILAVLLPWIWRDTGERAELIKVHGANLAVGIAASAADAARAENSMQLAVLANRLVALPEVAGVTFYSVENRELATGGTDNGTPHTATLVADSELAGYVRLTLNDAAYARPIDPVRLAMTLLAAVAVPGLLLLVTHASMTPTTTSVPVVSMPVEDPPKRPRYTIIANLHEPASVERGLREQQLDRALAFAEEVASLYHADAALRPGKGVVLTFDGSGDGDRPYQVVCATFLLMRLLADDHEFGEFRFGAHRLDDEGDPDDPGLIEDLSLLAALAREGTLVMSSTFHGSVRYAERLTSQPFEHPLIGDVELDPDGYVQVHDVASNHRLLIEQQADALLNE